MTQDKLEKIISNPKTPLTRIEELVSEYVQEQDKQTWMEARRAEYDALFPATREMTDAEKTANNTAEDGTAIVREDGYVYPLMNILYVKTKEDIVDEARVDQCYVVNKDYVTFVEYLAETKVITPAVAEVVDANGMVTTPAVPAVTSLVREFVPKKSYKTQIDNYFANSKAWKARLKKNKVEALDMLTITANTIVYNADGKAINNMSGVVNLANWNFNKAVAGGTSASDAYQAIYKGTKINWKSANNEIHTIQVEAICEALNSSMKKIAKVIGVQK